MAIVVQEVGWKMCVSDILVVPVLLSGLHLSGCCRLFTKLRPDFRVSLSGQAVAGIDDERDEIEQV
jgi:hypothetical protein